MKHKIHHIGYAVNSIAASLLQFEQLGYTKTTEKTVDIQRNVEILFMKNGDYLIELIAPLEKQSSVENILKKVGPAPYHICYFSDAIEESVRYFKGIGFLQLSNPLPAPAIDNKNVVFLFHKEIGLIELVEH